MYNTKMAEALKFIEGEGLQSQLADHPETFQSFAQRLARHEVLAELGRERRGRIAGILGMQERDLEMADYDALLKALGDDLTRSEEHGVTLIRNAIAEKRAAAIDINGELAAFGAYMEWKLPDLPPLTKDGRRIFMLTKATTMPGFERRGYNKAIRQKRIEMIQREDPNALILVISQQDAVKNQCKGFGWDHSQKIWELLDDCDHTQDWKDEGHPNHVAFMKKYKGYQGLDSTVVEQSDGTVLGKYEAFLFDPKTLQAE